MVGWHYPLNEHNFFAICTAYEQTPAVGDGQGSLACCSPWGHKESDTTLQLNWTETLSNIMKFKELMNLQPKISHKRTFCVYLCHLYFKLYSFKYIPSQANTVSKLNLFMIPINKCVAKWGIWGSLQMLTSTFQQNTFDIFYCCCNLCYSDGLRLCPFLSL